MKKHLVPRGWIHSVDDWLTGAAGFQQQAGVHSHPVPHGGHPGRLLADCVRTEGTRHRPPL